MSVLSTLQSVNQTKPTLPYPVSGTGAPVGESSVRSAVEGTTSQSTVVLSEGSSAYCDKGPMSLSCNRSIEKSKPAHCYRSVSFDLKNKLFQKLDSMHGASVSARDRGAFSISEEEFGRRISCHDAQQYEVQSNEVLINRTTWRETVREALSTSTFDVLVGSTGLGKTTVIPEFIREEKHKSVYVVEPTVGLAYHVYTRYRQLGVPVVFDPEEESGIIPPDHIVVGDGVSLLKRMMFSGSDISHVGCVYLDEYHAAGAAYSIIRYMLSNMSGGIKVMMATATLNVEVSASRVGEDVPKTSMKIFDYQDARRWEMGVVQEPWSPRSMKPGKWLMLLPGHQSVIRYYLRYKDMNVLYISDRFDYKKNEAVIQKFNAMKVNAPVILLATPGFGYGYNFDCDYVVDSGFTEDVVLNEKCGVQYRRRFVTMNESIQRIGRLARFGKAGEYYTWQRASDKRHFCDERNVDNSVNSYYKSLYAALFDMKFRDNGYEGVLRSSRQAATLIDCRFISFPLLNCVGIRGGVYRAFQDARGLFYNTHVVDMTLEPKMYYIHVDFEKQTFIYHFEENFFLPVVSEYSKIFLSMFDSRIQKAVVVPQHIVDMSTVAGAVSKSRKIDCEKKENIPVPVYDRTLEISYKNVEEEKKAGSVKPTVSDRERSVRMKRSPSGRMLYDIEEEESKEASDEESEDSKMVREVYEMLTTPDVVSPAETKGKEREKASGSTAIRRIEKAAIVKEGEREKLGEGSEQRNDTTDDASSVVPLLISEAMSERREVPYEKHCRKILNELSKYITLSESVLVPFMTLYQEHLGHRSYDSFSEPPFTGRYTVPRLRKMFIGIGQMYTPLLSTRNDHDYLVATEKDEKKVLRWMGDSNVFVKGTSLDRYEKFDVFVKVWNSLTLRYLSMMSISVEGETEKFSRFKKIITFGSYKSEEEVISDCVDRLNTMMKYYVNILRKHDLLLVPFKSGNTSRRDSFNTRIRSWCEGAAYDWGFNSANLISLGWSEISPTMKETYGRTVMALERREGLDVITAGGLYVGRNTLYTVSHFLDVDQRISACAMVNGASMNYSAYGKGFEAMDAGGATYRGSGVVSHRTFDLVKCALPEIGELERFDAETLKCRPRQMYSGEFVRVLVSAYDIETCSIKIYESPIRFASFVRESYQGICDLTCVPGMSGGVVVSCEDDRPIGLVTSENSNIGEGKLIFSTFSAILLGVVAHPNDNGLALHDNCW